MFLKHSETVIESYIVSCGVTDRFLGSHIHNSRSFAIETGRQGSCDVDTDQSAGSMVM